METRYFLGIDVAKEGFHATLTVDGLNFFDQEVKNNPTCIREYFSQLQSNFRFRPEQLIVCMEHTGIYCYPLLNYLTKREIKICVEPAIQIIKSQGLQRGKNDKIDSRRIAKYLYKNHCDIKPWIPKRVVLQNLKALLVVRDRLLKAKNMLEVPIKESKEFIEISVTKHVEKTCKNSIKAIQQDIKKIDQEIEMIVKSDEAISQQMKLATSVVGVGPIIGANMIVTTNEFKEIRDHKKYACYSGIAPFEHRSGTSIRGRTKVSNFANKNMKKLLHLGARSAVLHSPELKLYYQRKLAEGKPPMSILNAVCNKLISRVFVCINENRLYQKNYAKAVA
jgi:transposase